MLTPSHCAWLAWLMNQSKKEKENLNIREIEFLTEIPVVPRSGEQLAVLEVVLALAGCRGVHHSLIFLLPPPAPWEGGTHVASAGLNLFYVRR